MGKKPSKKHGKTPSKWQLKLAERVKDRTKDTKYGKKFQLSWWEVPEPLYEIDEETFEVIEVSSAFLVAELVLY